MKINLKKKTNLNIFLRSNKKKYLKNEPMYFTFLQYTAFQISRIR